MRRIFTICLVLTYISLAPLSYGQNLVNNPSFESVNTGSLLCSWYVSVSEFNAAINGWAMPTGGSTDIFHTSLATSCFCSPYSTHASSPGTQTPHSGNSMSAVFVYGNGGCSPYREYLQGSLSSSLVPGTQYCVEFYVSMADYSMYAVNNIGVYFTTSSFYTSSMCVYTATPQLNYTGPIITDKTNWTLISMTFTPTAAYNYFTIGNFYSDAATSFINVGGSKAQTRYFIDDVSVQVCSPNPTVTTTNTSICQGQSGTVTASSNIAGTTFLWNTGGTGSSLTVSPSVTTTYTVTGTAPSGGTDSEVAVVTVNPNPSVTAGASPSTICAGQTTTLTASGASTYNWNPGGLSGSSVIVSPSSTTTYTVTGTSTQGCTGTATVLVTVNSAPNVSASANPASICTGQCSNLTASGASTYSWMPGSLTGSSVNVCPTSSTTYTVTGTSGGCTASSTVSVTINPTLNITAGTNSPTICPGACATLNATGGDTYTWTPGSMTGSSINVCPSATTIYTVNASSIAGCTGSATVTVSLAANPVVGATVTPGTICAGGSATLNATGASTYVWNPGSMNGSSIIVNPNSSTNYTVTGTSTQGCTGTGSVTLNVTANPVVSATANPASICIGSCSDLTATGATTYTWMPGTLSGASVNVCPTGTTTYTVTGSNGGCSNSTTVTVTVNNAPVLTISSTDPDLCSGECTDLIVAGATNALWTPGNLSGLQVTVCPTTTTTYTVLASNPSGCTESGSITIQVNPNPTISLQASPPSICAGECSNLNASGADTYIWSISGITGNSTQVCPTTTTSYAVTGTSLAGCSGSNQVTVTVNTLPGIIATASPDTICPGQSTTLIATGASSYTWAPGNMNGASVNVSPNQTTLYVVTGNTNGCTGQANVNVVVLSEPYISFTSDIQSGCEDLAVQFLNLCGDTLATYLWDFGDGSTSTDYQPSHIYSDPGQYDVSLTIYPLNGCTASLEIPGMISVYPVPVADFSFNPLIGNIEDPEISFFDHSLDAAIWYWDFGDSNSFENNSVLQNPEHFYSDTGSYLVTLIVSSLGCYDTTQNYIIIQPSVFFFIPNAFSPGTDGLNNYFSCYGVGIDENSYKMRIFNRWGEQLFFTDLSEPGWDGKYKGKIVSPGVYIYLIDFVDVNMNEHHYKGIVNVVR